MGKRRVEMDENNGNILEECMVCMRKRVDGSECVIGGDWLEQICEREAWRRVEVEGMLSGNLDLEMFLK